MYWITGEGTRIFFLLCGNYAGSTKQHELTFCAQALRKRNMNYAGTARNQPPQPTLAQHNMLILWLGSGKAPGPPICADTRHTRHHKSWHT